MEDQQAGPLKNVYLTRYAAYPHPLITKAPGPELDLIITIPCYNEPDLIASLNALYQCDIGHLHAEVIVIINEAANAPAAVTKQNEACFKEAIKWSEERSTHRLLFHILYHNDLPPKHAGVGLARKIVMDEAVRRFEQVNKPDGVILCFDADSTCDSNYLQAVHDFFEHHPKAPGCSIYFEHPLEGSYDDEIYEAITNYELFLRYYVNALRYAGFPYAYETIGSSMAVRSRAYQKQGGMNRRKAGEDFYFLHKIIPIGHFGEVNTTRVIPSPRRSDRVPFGTGKAVNDWLQTGSLLTYDLATFMDLKVFLAGISSLYRITPNSLQQFIRDQPDSMRDFLDLNDFSSHIKRIDTHASAMPAFTKHFFHWFDGFKVLKYVHYCRDHYYPNIPVQDGARALLKKIMPGVQAADGRQLLEAYRKNDRSFKH